MACNEIGNQLMAQSPLTEKGKEPKQKTESLFRRILDLVPEDHEARADTSWRIREKATFDTSDIYGDP